MDSWKVENSIFELRLKKITDSEYLLRNYLKNKKILIFFFWFKMPKNQICTKEGGGGAQLKNLLSYPCVNFSQMHIRKYDKDMYCI
jgi:hypothetical protein